MSASIVTGSGDILALVCAAARGSVLMEPSCRV